MAQLSKRTLFVGGLDENVSEAVLRAAFIPFGDIIEVHIPKDHVKQSNRGFGFVEFEEEDDAAAAVDNMNDSEIFGRVIRVKFSKGAHKKLGGKPVWAQAEMLARETAEGAADGAPAAAGAPAT